MGDCHPSLETCSTSLIFCKSIINHRCCSFTDVGQFLEVHMSVVTCMFEVLVKIFSYWYGQDFDRDTHFIMIIGWWESILLNDETNMPSYFEIVNDTKKMFSSLVSMLYVISLVQLMNVRPPKFFGCHVATYLATNPPIYPPTHLPMVGAMRIYCLCCISLLHFKY